MLLIDGDILVYSVANACETRWYEVEDPETGFINTYKGKKDVKKYCEWVDTTTLVPERSCVGEEVAVKITRDMVNSWKRKLKQKEYRMLLTHKDINENFRKKLSPSYKENRKGLIKPILYQFMRDHLIESYNGEVVTGYEADDALGIYQTDKTIIVSKDKDLLQVPGKHYNITSGKVIVATNSGSLTLKRDKANKPRLIGTGFKFFCAQMLLGDTVDNIKGINRYGPVKVHGLLSKLRSKRKMWEAVCKVYKDTGRDDILVNAQLLWILREEGCYFNEDLI